jgi:hypothetical protein
MLVFFSGEILHIGEKKNPSKSNKRLLGKFLKENHHILKNKS